MLCVDNQVLKLFTVMPGPTITYMYLLCLALEIFPGFHVASCDTVIKCDDNKLGIAEELVYSSIELTNIFKTVLLVFSLSKLQFSSLLPSNTTCPFT